MRSIIVAAAALLAASSANAAVFIVDSVLNSSNGGTGLGTIHLQVGQAFKVTASDEDLWNLGDLPRWANADGIAPRIATGTDESGLPAGTVIGADFGLWSQDGFDAPYGAIVGEIGGVYQLLGLNFSGPAWGTGTLNLYNWDSYRSDNSGTISVEISAVPEPATWMTFVAGFILTGYAARRQRRNSKAV